MTRFSDEEWIEALKKAVADKGEEFVYHITWIIFVFLGVGVCGAIDQQQWHKRQKESKEGEKT